MALRPSSEKTTCSFLIDLGGYPGIRALYQAIENLNPALKTDARPAVSLKLSRGSKLRKEDKS